MFSNKKRKFLSSPANQQTISKFFKPSSEKRVKKVLKIEVINDECDKKSPKQSQRDEIVNDRIVKNNAKSAPKLVSHHAFKKLQKFELNNEECGKGEIKENGNEENLNKENQCSGTSHKVGDDNANNNLAFKDIMKLTSVENKLKDNKLTKITAIKKYTPLEKQFLEVKARHDDTVLFVECGYKYRFFGEDAEIASKVLNIFCHLDHNFMTASIPVHRLNVHVGRLVEKGYKVGVVAQTETAALKAAGDNKNAPFTRKLAHLYTRATYIDKEDESSSGHFLISITLFKESLNKQSYVNIVAVNPTTGNITYERLVDDDTLITRLDTVFHVINPAEIILQHDISKNSIEKFIQRYQQLNKLTRIEKYRMNQVISNENLHEGFMAKFNSEGLWTSVILLQHYLKPFKLDTILSAFESYQPFTKTKQWMRFDSTTIKNLELLANNTNNEVKGSVYWVLNHAITSFGKRLLKSWLRQPLVSYSKINERLEAVTELTEHLENFCVKGILKHFYFLPDLEKGVTRIYHRKINPEGFIAVLENIEKINLIFQQHQNIAKETFQSSLLHSIYDSIPKILGIRISTFLEQLNKKEIVAGNKTHLFKDLDKFPYLKEINEKISDVEKELDEYKNNNIRKLLRDRALEYKTVSGLEYLVEVKNSNSRIIPNDWLKISSTKQVSRYRSPFVEENFKVLCQLREALVIESNKCWDQYLDEFAESYQEVLKAVDYIAQFDCLVSLAIVSKQPGYCKPLFVTDRGVIDINDGRHLVISSLLDEDQQYVPNDTHLQDENKAMLISGPNMGGKSSYIKQVAIICILAQIGCYVPANSATLSVLDGVFTRMGALDNMWKGKSTLMIELEEASVIMKEATSKSLVILDELGRGTSTYDGTAIAYATLKYFLEEVKSFTLFVTHHPLLCDFETLQPSLIKNYHMAYMNSVTDFDHVSSNSEEDAAVQATNIIFLYKLTEGAAGKSYGLNVAKLARLDQSILVNAAAKSKELETKCISYKRQVDWMLKLFRSNESTNIKDILSGDFIE